jgi:ribulose-5-phosphate 4-epimerase/fuculose-1-phosphate aldolase
LQCNSPGNISLRLGDGWLMTPAHRLARCRSSPISVPATSGSPKPFAAFAGKHHAVSLADNGPVVGGSNLDAAINAIEELEETAKLYLLLRGANTQCLTPAQIAELGR